MVADIVVNREVIAESVDNECIICRENYSTTVVRVKLLCRHTFCEECLIHQMGVNECNANECDEDWEHLHCGLCRRVSSFPMAAPNNSANENTGNDEATVSTNHFIPAPPAPISQLLFPVIRPYRALKTKYNFAFNGQSFAPSGNEPILGYMSNYQNIALEWYTVFDLRSNIVLNSPKVVCLTEIENEQMKFYAAANGIYYDERKRFAVVDAEGQLYPPAAVGFY